jgi:hypothetical protein
MAGARRSLSPPAAAALPSPRLADWRGAESRRQSNLQFLWHCRQSLPGTPCPAATLLQANLDEHCEEGDEGTCMVHVT